MFTATGDNSTATISVANNEVKQVSSYSIPNGGTYLFICIIDWKAQLNPSGFRALLIGVDDYGATPTVPHVSGFRDREMATHPVSGSDTYCQNIFLLKSSTLKTVRLYGYQNSGAVLDCYPKLTSIRLKSYQSN